jgi:hypothetical protein
MQVGLTDTQAMTAAAAKPHTPALFMTFVGLSLLIYFHLEPKSWHAPANRKTVPSGTTATLLRTQQAIARALSADGV